MSETNLLTEEVPSVSGETPPPGAEDKARMFRILGCPDCAESYRIDVSHGLFRDDPEINARMHALGVTQEQLQAMYDVAAERLVPMVAEVARDYFADRELERLVQDFGGPERWREVSRQLLAFGRKTLPPQVLDGLAASYEGVRALYQLMEQGMPGSIGGGVGVAEPVEDEASLQRLMRDPRYWKAKDPAFIARVTSGFERLYGGA